MRNFPSLGQKSLFAKFIIGFIVVVFLIVIGGAILTIVNPKLAGEMMAPAIEAQDAACFEGCRNSRNQDACYDGCMRSYNDDYQGRRRRTGF